MKEQLFHPCFKSQENVESLFGESEPSFQYIVTTTTPPPPELDDDEGPFVRLMLDARSSNNHIFAGDLLTNNSHTMRSSRTTSLREFP